MPLIGTLTSGVSAMTAFTKDLEVIGNNIANVNTYGFKGSTVSFNDSFSNTLRSSSPSTSSSSNTSAIQVGTGVKVSGVNTNFSQGTTTATGSATDLAISGDGYFVVQNPANSEIFVTRAGNFKWDDNGYLVTDQGYRVMGDLTTTASTKSNIIYGGSLTAIRQQGTSLTATNPEFPPVLPAAASTLKTIAMGPNGTITGTYSDSTTHVIGSVVLATFSDPSALMKQGNNLYSGFTAAGLQNKGATDITKLTQTNGSPQTGSLGTLQSQQLELSNVDLTQQFSDMITVQRSFQASSRLITVSDQILEEIVNLKH